MKRDKFKSEHGFNKQTSDIMKLDHNAHFLAFLAAFFAFFGAAFLATFLAAFFGAALFGAAFLAAFGAALLATTFLAAVKVKEGKVIINVLQRIKYI